MTDKQIMVDGVDVSGCECCSQIDLDTKIICISNFPGKKGGYCKDNTNCLYKQLIRKTQECEELKKANIHIDNNRMVKSNKLKKIEEYCREQNLKADYTACKILQIIDEVE